MVSVGRRQPSFRAVAAASLHEGRYRQFPTGSHDCPDILPPAVLVEIGRQERVRLLLEHDVYPEGMTSLQMVQDRLVVQVGEAAVRALPALDPWPVAEGPILLVGAYGLVTMEDLAVLVLLFLVFPVARVNVLPASKEAAEQGNLRIPVRRPRCGLRQVPTGVIATIVAFSMRISSRVASTWRISSASIASRSFRQLHKSTRSGGYVSMIPWCAYLSFFLQLLMWAE